MRDEMDASILRGLSAPRPERSVRAVLLVL
jgi:hypothetical protein